MTALTWLKDKFAKKIDMNNSLLRSSDPLQEMQNMTTKDILLRVGGRVCVPNRAELMAEIQTQMTKYKDITGKEFNRNTVGDLRLSEFGEKSAVVESLLNIDLDKKSGDDVIKKLAKNLVQINKFYPGAKSKEVQEALLKKVLSVIPDGKQREMFFFHYNVQQYMTVVKSDIFKDILRASEYGKHIQPR